MALVRKNSYLDFGVGIKKHLKWGWKKGDVLTIIQELGGSSARESFEEYIETTIDLPIASFFKDMGLGIEWESTNDVGFGFVHEIRDSRVFIKSVEIDSAAHAFGLNAGDEIIAINSLRIDRDNISDHLKNLKESNEYSFVVSRLGKLKVLQVSPKVLPKKIKSIKVLDQKTVDKFLKGELS